MVKPDGAGIRQFVDAAVARNQAAQVHTPCADVRDQRYALRNLDVVVEFAGGPPVEPDPRLGSPIRHEAQRITAQRKSSVVHLPRSKPHVIHPIEHKWRGHVLYRCEARVPRQSHGRIAGAGWKACRVPVVNAAPGVISASAVPCVNRA